MANYPTSALQPGSTGSEVKKLQDYLVSKGFMTQAQVNTGYGTYGPQTTAAVLALQKSLGVDYSSGPGYFGPKTIAKISGNTSSLNLSNNLTSTSSPSSTPAVSISQPKATTTPNINYTPAPVTPNYTPAPASTPVSTPTTYTGPSVVDYLNSVGKDSSKPARAALAAQYGIPNYTGTGPQNDELLNKLRSGVAPTPISNTPVIPPTPQPAPPTQEPNNKVLPGDTYESYMARNPVTDTENLSTEYIDPIKPKTDTNTNIPVEDTIPNDVIPESMQNLTVYNLPEEAFKELVPTLVPGTPEYQAAMDKLSTAFFDVMQQQMNAQTEQEQQAATYNWQTLKKTIETNLNITLSNDAYQAWDQVQTIANQAGQQNLQGSGIQNESIDSYLNKVRRADSEARVAAQTKQEAAQQDYMMKFATPAQVKAFALANPEKAKAWGLVPSDEVRNAMSAATLKAKYPNMSDEEIQSNIASMFDENGNYRSALYQKHMVGSSVGANMGVVDTANIVYDQYGNPLVKPVKPSDTGVLDIAQAKKQYQTLNTPLESQSKDYAERVKLGSIKPTAGTNAAGGSDTTLFNQITPTTGTQTSIKPTVTPSNPIVVPSAMTSTGSQTNNTTTPKYTFKKTPYGTVERYNNGVKESTGSADFMKAFGYKE
jgi:hypothetical protein